MVRKIVTIFLCVLLFCAFGTIAHAETFTPYEGNPSSTYITYFKDIISGIGFNDNYIALRSGQNEYVMIVGDLNYSNGKFTLNDVGTLYEISQEGNYNSYYKYNVREINELTVTPTDKIIYSDLGQFPQLVERGAKYEILSTLLICIICVYCLARSIFRKR